VNTDQKDFLFILGYLYLQHLKFHKSVVLFEVLHELHPEDLQVLKCLSYNYYVLADYTQALNVIDQTIERSTTKKDKIISHLLKAKILWSMGEIEEARIFLKFFIDNQYRLT
jgi:tetratricopeptide (TPR) repeat protein